MGTSPQALSAVQPLSLMLGESLMPGEQEEKVRKPTPRLGVLRGEHDFSLLTAFTGLSVAGLSET